MNWLMNKLTGLFVSKVQSSAAAYGGHCTWQFSQSMNPVATLIGSNADTSQGICELLSAKWIDEHAHEGALANWVTKGKSIDASKIRLLMQLFVIGEKMQPAQMIGRTNATAIKGVRGGAANQDSGTQNFLLSRGIIRRGGGKPDGWGKRTVQNGTKLGIDLANDICDSRGGTGSYRIIGIYGSGGGHAMASYTGMKDIAFFDPNYGEFWFEDKNKFKKWFAGSFFKTNYEKDLGTTFELFDYALRARR